MSEPVTSQDSMTTAEVLGRFARELANYDEIDIGARQALLIEAGQRLFDGLAYVVVASDV